MAKDINKEPFDEEATLAKLLIFEQYLKEWLPVFIHTHPSLAIYDFFAGSGQDSKGAPGSPLRILQALQLYRDDIFKKKATVRVVLNELVTGKHEALKTLVESEVQKASWGEHVTVEVKRDEFQALFRNEYRNLRRQPNLIFIDQYGVKQVTKEIFEDIIKLDKTDFLFFVSSSFMKRFAGREEFLKHFPDINDFGDLAKAKHQDVHRIMLRYYRFKIPRESPVKLYPFTLKKGTNIYGLIFGSKHSLGVEKFLNTAWKANVINGEANFDIDEDAQKQGRYLFTEAEPLTKRKSFESKLEAFITSKPEVSNRDVRQFTLDAGHPPKHAQECVSRLKKEGKVGYSGSIGFSYNSCIKRQSKVIKRR